MVSEVPGAVFLGLGVDTGPGRTEMVGSNWSPGLFFPPTPSFLSQFRPSPPLTMENMEVLMDSDSLILTTRWKAPSLPYVFEPMEATSVGKFSRFLWFGVYQEFY